jgi:FlaA1/EpsC-like NDP-sugar epimerase
MGKPVKIYDLARTLIKLSGYEPDEDIKIVFTGMRPGEKMYEELQSAEEQVQLTDNKKIFLIPPPYIDAIKLRKELMRLKYLASCDSEKAVENLYSIISGNAVYNSGSERRLSGLNG